ncbi:unnamed protein product [Caenorhabditis sp. 36 PRJEB53466]|nr:unnamed protein product [Caenorhabditis sp. 36 PRJEB53466]
MGTMSTYNSAFNSFFLRKILAIHVARCLKEVLSGERCTIELMRRTWTIPATKERMIHAFFILDIERPANMFNTAVGLKILVKNEHSNTN